MQPETNASSLLVEIDLSSDQAGEDKLAGYSPTLVNISCKNTKNVFYVSLDTHVLFRFLFRHPV